MLKKFRNKSGQSISAEVVITFVLVTVAIVAMSTYIRRTMQARVRDAVIFTRDEASSALGGANVALQYEPYYASAEAKTSQASTTRVKFGVNGEFIQDSRQGRSVVSNSVQLAPKDDEFKMR
jgi:Tfp pilus assembly protein PilV